MTFSNMITQPANSYIQRELVGYPKEYDIWSRKDDNGFRKEILARGAYAILAPINLTARALDSIVGVGAAIATVATLGMSNAINKCANKNLVSFNLIIASPYLYILRIINPEARAGHHEGLFKIARLCEKQAFSFSLSDDVLVRHVASRLTYALARIAEIITRIAYAVIAIPAAALSILTCGKFASLNGLAYKALGVPGIVTAIFRGTIEVINPFSSIEFDI